MTSNEDEKPTEQLEAAEPAQPQASEPPPEVPVAQAPAVVDLRRPAWLSRTVAIAGGVAAATFVVGGAAGFAVGHATGDDGRGRPDRFLREGGPGFRGDGFPGDRGPGFQQGPQQQGPQQQGPQQDQQPGTTS